MVARSGHGLGHAGRQRGFALMAALLALVVVSLATIVAVDRARQDAQREREAQLLWIGNQYRMALHSYHDLNPAGGVQQYPQRLEDLLADERGPALHRHLRQLYADPFTGKLDWVLEREGGRIVGLHSSSSAVPVRRAGFSNANAGFASAKTYADWRFLGTDQVDYSGAAPLASAPPPGTDNTNNPSTPPPPPDPVTAARTQCNASFGAPGLRCVGPDFPMGNSVMSCRRAMSDALAQCMAPMSGAGAGSDGGS